MDDNGTLILALIALVAMSAFFSASETAYTSLNRAQERNIVTNVAGTTRDSIHTRYNMYGMDFYLIDTAGMRKKGKVTEDLEFYSVMRSIRAIENSDVCVLMYHFRVCKRLRLFLL